MKSDQIAYLVKTRMPVLFRAIDLLSRNATKLRYGRSRKEALSRAALEGTINCRPAVVRPLTVSDRDALSGFLRGQKPEWVTYFRPHGFSPKHVEEVLSSGSHCCYGIMVEDVLAAYCLVKLFPIRNAYCGLMAAPRFTGVGLGRFIWSYLIWQCVSIGVQPCATIHSDNLASRNSLLAVRPQIREFELSNGFFGITIPVEEGDSSPPELDL